MPLLPPAPPPQLACSPVKQSCVKTPGDGEEACGVDGQDGGGSGLIGSSPDLDDLPPQEQRQALKRQLTKHVVTRWYRAPELILLQVNQMMTNLTIVSLARRIEGFTVRRSLLFSSV